jgi:hypothetical protein
LETRQSSLIWLSVFNSLQQLFRLAFWASVYHICLSFGCLKRDDLGGFFPQPFGPVRNRDTRRAYFKAAREFSAFCAQVGPVHVTALVERQPQTSSPPTVK